MLIGQNQHSVTAASAASADDAARRRILAGPPLACREARLGQYLVHTRPAAAPHTPPVGKA